MPDNRYDIHGKDAARLLSDLLVARARAEQAEVEALRESVGPFAHYSWEAMEALRAVGMGKNGKPNCLIDMILEACAEIRTLRVINHS
jgi:hypothetical protein